MSKLQKVSIKEVALKLPRSARDAMSAKEMVTSFPSLTNSETSFDSRLRTMKNRLMQCVEHGSAMVVNGRPMRFYCATDVQKKLKKISAIDADITRKEGGSRSINSELSYGELKARVIGFSKSTPFTNIIQPKFDLLRSAIKYKRKVTLEYAESLQLGSSTKRKGQLITIEPVGLVKNRRVAYLIALSSCGSQVALQLSKITDCELVHNTPLFNKLTQDEAIAILNSGIEEGFLESEVESITMEVSNEALDLFLNEHPHGSSEWDFHFICEHQTKAMISFKKRITQAFVDELIQLGDDINVIESASLLKYLTNGQSAPAEIGIHKCDNLNNLQSVNIIDFNLNTPLYTNDYLTSLSWAS
ncbi:hypothetical protein GCM10009128_26240 [Psychrosphaera haliotis]|uniref:WYL domain-containing protein n=1 Tax=Psychrosphaera haliotis TaxID=555083 RepID=UPI0031DD784E